MSPGLSPIVCGQKPHAGEHGEGCQLTTELYCKSSPVRRTQSGQFVKGEEGKTEASGIDGIVQRSQVFDDGGLDVRESDCPNYYKVNFFHWSVTTIPVPCLGSATGSGKCVRISVGVFGRGGLPCVQHTRTVKAAKRHPDNRVVRIGTTRVGLTGPRTALPVVVRPGDLFYKSGPGIGSTLIAREVGPPTFQGKVETPGVMIAIDLAIRPFRFSITLHQHWTWFHFSAAPPVRVPLGPRLVQDSLLRRERQLPRLLVQVAMGPSAQEKKPKDRHSILEIALYFAGHVPALLLNGLRFKLGNICPLDINSAKESGPGRFSRLRPTP
jgi:hypothetical protein